MTNWEIIVKQLLNLDVDSKVFREEFLWLWMMFWRVWALNWILNDEPALKMEGLRPSWFSVHCTSLTRGPGVWESRGRTEGMTLDSYWDQIVKKLRNQAETLGAFQAGLSHGKSTKARVRMALMSLSALPSPSWVIPSPSLSGTQEWVRWPSLAPIFLMWEAIRRYWGLLKVPHGNLWQCVRDGLKTSWLPPKPKNAEQRPG